jgi:hypothetical protein
MVLAPDSSEKIEADTVEVLSELLSHEDAFAGGNQARLGGLESARRDWNADGTHNAEVARIRDFVHSSCNRYPAAGETSQQQPCRSFLLPAEPGDQDAL